MLKWSTWGREFVFTAAVGIFETLLDVFVITSVFTGASALFEKFTKSRESASRVATTGVAFRWNSHESSVVDAVACRTIELFGE